MGPNFKRPAPPPVNSYTAQPITSTAGTTNVAGGEAQRFVEGLEIPGQWWALFHSEPLNELIKRSLTNNPDLKAAQAALLVAQENLRAQRGAFYPNVCRIFRRQPPEAVRVSRADAQRQCVSNTIYSRRKSACPIARCFRPEPANGRVLQGAGTKRAFPNDRDVSDARAPMWWWRRFRRRRCGRRLKRHAS